METEAREREAREHTGQLVIFRGFGPTIKRSWNGDANGRLLARAMFDRFSFNAIRGEVRYTYRNEDGSTRVETRSSARYVPERERASFDPDAESIEFSLPSHG